MYCCEMYHIAKHGIKKMYTVDVDSFFFLVSVNCYQRRILNMRVTNEGLVVTRFLSTCRCYLTSETRFLNTRRFSIHINDAFFHVTNLFTSQTQHK
jgi:hypothetical protein